ncbi:hypothetical protein AURDEDRAFT_124479 [Auricularia subglabra TFB-10046 SS5]|nr:hypothetical protein AURDEDRAFT_124479 [Auricularia subglabra TFB-10046 SS5]
MALQETHLSEEHVAEIEKFHKHIKILNSQHPENPTGAGGVALVFNRLLTNTESIETHEIVPGRAILATWHWHRTDRLTVLAVYAPTDRVENEEFWKQIKNKIQQTRGKFPKPDAMLGDFNMVEDAIDRFPARLHPIDVPESFVNLKRYLKMLDGWRETFPDSKEWTWRNAARSSMSRIDRIYLTKDMITVSREWKTVLSGLNANDHSRIMVTIANLDAPQIGRGRWAMSQQTATDPKVLRECNRVALSAQEAIRRCKNGERSEALNPQRIWARLKQEIVSISKKRMRELNCAKKQNMDKLVAAREEAKVRLGCAENTPEKLGARAALRKAEEAITTQEEKEHGETFERRDTRTWAYAETMHKSWFQWTKENKPRDTIASLRRPESDPPTFVADSPSMAELAGEYHDSIQRRDLDVEEEEREEAIREVLTHIERRMDQSAVEEASQLIDRENVLESITSAKNGTAAGLDGIIYEFWKAMNKMFQQKNSPDSPWVDIVGMLADSRDIGGVELFCAADRNEAQYIKWLGDFLDTSDERPLWAFIADQLFRAAIRAEDRAKIPLDQRVNPFFQNWKPNVRKLPFILQELYRVAGKYHLAFDAPDIPQEIRESMNIWSHPAKIDPPFRNRLPWTVRCLKKHHAVTTVEHLEEIAELDDVDHESNSDCICENCTSDRAEGCRHPHRCQNMASELLASVSGKWNTAVPEWEDPQELQETFGDDQARALADDDVIVFQKDVLRPRHVAQMGRLFVNAIGLEPAPAGTLMRREPGEKDSSETGGAAVQIIVCAGMTQDSTDEAVGGYTIVFPDREFADVDRKCAGSEQTYTGALAKAIVHAAEIVPGGRDLYVIMTSRTMIRYMTVDRRRQENTGWMDTKEAGVHLRAAVAALKARKGETAFYHASAYTR